MMGMKVVMEDLKPAMMMIVVQVGYAGVSILYKVVSNDEGNSLIILVAYRFLFASLFMLPLAFFVERKSTTKITVKVLLQALMCGLFGGTVQQNLFVQAVSLAGATYATATINLVPGATYVLAVCFGLEKANIGRGSGKAKVGGTAMGIGGAMMLTFYKSTEIPLWSTHVNIIKHVGPHKVSSNEILGIALGFASCLSYSLWLIIQARMSEKFARPYTSAALMCMMAAIQSVIFAIFMERDWSRWNLAWNTFLLTALYAGIVASGVAWILITCCVRLKGPLYTSIFNPLFLILVAIAGSLLLDERLSLGSLLGSILIIMGLYAVLWGKGKEFQKKGVENGEVEDSVELGDSSLQTTTTNNDDHHQHANKSIIIEDKSGGGGGDKSKLNDEEQDVPFETMIITDSNDRQA